ncbi:G-type lectin S-receptor-like serine/threonine-protein kinase At4g27290 isoform X2 [Neltuma alba]|uniref:G-type lectin S-receptor-like serine/threonine-protein kinase At4g27290 isoform X2 n=1 Tax=Neltuma alba TaxID=207710 RepID=UPI0010A4DEBF|nr:G-type lectin S-receptor-like serine/threonine-protein kinase At4g27290 isoform X2 [Prosopis alba]
MKVQDSHGGDEVPFHPLLSRHFLMEETKFSFTLFFLATCFSLISLFPTVLKAKDSITSAQSITDSQTLVSPDEKFELGFFSPGNSSLKYLGIWYKYIPKPTVIWVANRDSPLVNSSGTLTFSNDGKLVILSHTGSIIWSANSSRSPRKPLAQLLDSGNLVLRDLEDESSVSYRWQSFDYPSDTFIPGMRLGWNFKTGFSRHLTSWKSHDDPSSGEYSYSVDPRGLPQLFLLKGKKKVFRSGPWFAQQLKGDPALMDNPVFKPVFVFNSDEVIFTYETKDSVTSRFVLTQSGLIQHFSWSDPRSSWIPEFSVQGDRCDDYGICGAYGSCTIRESPICKCMDGFEPRLPQDWQKNEWSDGCVMKNSHTCRNGEGFKKLTGVKLPDSAVFHTNSSLSFEECETECLKNCSCVAYATLDINTTGKGCISWFGVLFDIREVAYYGQDLYIRVPASELGSNAAVPKRNKHIIIIVAVSVSSAIVVLVSWFIIKRWRIRETDIQLILNRPRSELPSFKIDIIEAATKKFSACNKIGEGGFGPVYRGKLASGQEIAVKRLSESSGQGLQEFKNEVAMISLLQHRNLVKLLGCCIHKDERMLIYEYMPNRSLDSLLFDETKRSTLTWQKRLDIIVGVARGILYLHRDSRLKIIHRDLKASNVLLDSEMNPKISDFGMARIFGGDQTEAKTNRVVGTYGYMPPEYAIDGHFSFKSDVFSFGVLLLELLSGKKNKGFFHPDHKLNLLGHAWKLWTEEKAMELMDPLLENQFPASEGLRCIQVGLCCVQQKPEDRPTMSQVILMLDSESVFLPQPGRPGMYSERCFSETDSSSLAGINSCSNNTSITLQEGR